MIIKFLLLYVQSVYWCVPLEITTSNNEVLQKFKAMILRFLRAYTKLQGLMEEGPVQTFVGMIIALRLSQKKEDMGVGCQYSAQQPA